MDEIKKGPHRSDPLWTAVLSQLKTQALCLAPLFQDLNFNEEDSLEGRSGYQQFQSFLSQVEDSYDLTRMLFLSPGHLRSVSFSQIAEDVSENFARRFGALAASKVLILLEEDLPQTNSYPLLLMRILDGVVRAAQRVSSERGAHIAIRQTEGSETAKSGFYLSVDCLDLFSLQDLERKRNSLGKFLQGKYAHVLHEFGLDLCAALHLAVQLGAELSLEQEDNLSRLRIAFKFATHIPCTKPRAPRANTCFLLSDSPLLIESFRRIADFHGLDLKTLSNLSQLPEGAKLICDARENLQWTSFLRTLNYLPKDTIFVLPNTESDTVRPLSELGFKNFLPTPLVSIKLLKMLSHEESNEVAEITTSEKQAHALRVLVVDDTDTARILLKEQLLSLGHEVVEAYDGSDFIDLLQKGEHFDLAFCDLTMCHVDGLAAARIIREQEKAGGTRLPIALMTAYASLEDAKGKPDPAVDFLLNKPLALSEVKNVLSAVQEGRWRANTECEMQVIILDDLKTRCAGKSTVMLKVLNSFIELSPQLSAELQSEELRLNLEQQRRVLHKLKGVLGDVAAQEEAQAVASLEKKLGNTRYLTEGELASLNTWLDTASKAATRTIEELNNKLSTTQH